MRWMLKNAWFVGGELMLIDVEIRQSRLCCLVLVVVSLSRV
jgi:hypothetical protein